MAFEAFVEHYGTPDFLGDPAVPIFPGGESVTALSERVVAAMDDVVAAHPGEIVVVCTHGGVVEAAMRHVVERPRCGDASRCGPRRLADRAVPHGVGERAVANRPLQRRRSPARRSRRVTGWVVVGGGTAGCVVAARLSEDPLESR